MGPEFVDAGMLCFCPPRGRSLPCHCLGALFYQGTVPLGVPLFSSASYMLLLLPLQL